MSKYKVWLPFVFACILVLGIVIGFRLSNTSSLHAVLPTRSNAAGKLNEVLNYINQEYVDTINQKMLVENTIADMLHQLDPHSEYIPAEKLREVNEPLEGNFDGIGVEFHIQDDSIMVVTALAGGPSEQLGIQAGDRIVKIDGKNVAGIHITNQLVIKKLRGPNGTKVKVSIYRRGKQKLIDYTITRGKIPIYSVDVAYMINEETGYIKVSHFAQNTYSEYLDGFSKLQQQGMQNLILDLRGNPGGYLKTAIEIADEFLPEKKLIVYTEGRSRPKETFYATENGSFEKGKLIVLVDEGSASASEIVAGAMQDWDRGTVLGRRSFGKGLVQEQSSFPDGSAIRLTIARYYTPSGRSIQKPYDNGYDAYENELHHRYENGELNNTDSIRFADSLKFKTASGRTVYGGGGIMPDVFIPIDTSGTSDFYVQANSSGLLTQYAYNYVDNHRSELKKFTSFSQFNAAFEIDRNEYRAFVDYCLQSGVDADKKGSEVSSQTLCIQLKALIARQLWKNEGFYPVIHRLDNTVQKAVMLMQTNQVAER